MTIHMGTALEKINDMVPEPNTTDGFYKHGEVYHVTPYNQRTKLDMTSSLGVSSKIMFPFLFFLGKLGLKRMKVEEWMEISPVFGQYYQLTIQQKQQLESQIKAGLTSIATAAADLDLLLHDLRKYEEFLNYYEKIRRGKKEKNETLIMEGEQSLKSVFIDEVDVHTGEGIALKLIAPRWPTVIVDFMKLTDEDTDPKNIRDKYKVSEAEGVVLATKNKLYKHWREVFETTLKERYERLRMLIEARKRSFKEYRDMLRPYIVRYRSIRELGETEESRRLLDRFSWLKLGAQAVSLDTFTIWAWKAFHPPQFTKAGVEAETGSRDVLRMPFPRQFKEWIKPNYSILKKEGLDKLPLAPSGIEPLDKWCLGFIPVVEEHYGINFSLVDILKTRNEFINDCTGRTPPWIDPYFVCMEVKVIRGVFRLADGTEVENPMYDRFQPYLDTQNIILLRYLELKAKEMELENYITEMLGETAEGSKIKELMQTKYPETFGALPAGEKDAELKNKVLGFFRNQIQKSAEPAFRLFRPGPYEARFDDIISGPYFREMRDAVYGHCLNYIKTKYNVPGFKVPF